MNQGAPTFEPALLSAENDALRQMIEGVREVFWLSNPQVTRFEYVSPACEHIFGMPAQRLIEDASLMWEMVPEDDHPIIVEFIGNAIEKGEAGTEFRVRCTNGEIRWVRDRAFAIRDRFGNVRQLAGLVEDITDWKRIERELRDDADYFRLISDLTADYAYKTRILPDGTTVVERFSDGFTRVTGYTLEELNDRGGWEALIHPDDLAEVYTVNKDLPNLERVVGQLRIVTKGGEIRWIRYSSRMVSSVPGGPIDYIYGASQDITERHLAHERLRDLSARLFEVQEQERRFVARELHDEVGQILTGLSLKLSSIRVGQPDAPRRLEEAQQTLLQLTEQVRSMSLHLRPTMLDDLGLVPALLWLVERFRADRQLAVDFKHFGLSRRLAPPVETAAFRIVQEAITNVMRHAGVGHAVVRAWLEDGHGHVSVEDAGKGFDVEAARSSGLSAGLSGMEERASLLGGELSIESIPGRGTRVAAKLPLTPFERTPLK